MKKVTSILVVLFLALSLFTITACSKAELNATDIAYDGEYITWLEVAKAEHYLLSINGGQEEQLTGTSFQYTMGDTFTVRLSAVLKKETLSAEKTFTALPQVQNVRLDGKTIKWDEVEGAEAYVVMINSQKAATAAQTHFDLRASDVGNLSIKVMATKGTSYFSKWSGILQMTALAAPTNVVYDGARISWNAVPNATGYSVVINNGDPIAVTGTYLLYAANKQNVSIKVQATGASATTVPSEFSETKDYLYLSPITTFSVVDGVLVWEEIDNAVRYTLKVGAMQTTVEHPRYEGMMPGQSYNISVRPEAKEGSNYFSEFSDTETINLLSTPTIWYSNNDIMWSSISNAEGYKVVLTKNGTVVGQPETVASGNVLAWEIGSKLNDVAEYKVTVQAITSQESYWPGRPSDAIQFTRLAAPGTHTIVDDPKQLNATTVSFPAVVGASGYSIASDEIVIDYSSGSTFRLGVNKNNALPANEDEVIQVSIQSLGSSDASGKKYVLGSATAYTFTVRRLATPQNLDVSNGRITWDMVTGSSGYMVSVDGEKEPTYTSGNEMMVPQMSSGEHKITVRARGNGQNVFSSAFSNEFRVYKLAAPGNPGFKNVTVEGASLEWDSVNRAMGYKVLIGTEPTPSIATNAYNVAASSLQVGGTKIQVVALGNSKEIIDSDESTHVDALRLAAPTDIGVERGNVRWNAPSNASTYAITYTVLIGGVEKETSVGSSTGWSGRNLNVGDNVITVQATCSAPNVFSSALSLPQSIQKLAPVVAEISADKTGFAWTPVVNAQGYEVSFGNNKKGYNNDVQSVAIAEFINVASKSNTMQFRAVGSDAANIVGSEETSVTFVSQALATPLGVTRVYNAETKQLSISVENYTTPLEEQKFKFTIGGVDSTPDGTTFVHNVSAGAEIRYSVTAIGAKFGADGIYYIDSLRSTESTVSMFGSPVIGNRRSITGGSQLSWLTVNGVNNYEYTYRCYDANGIVVKEVVAESTAATSVNVTHDDSVKSIELEVRAKGADNHANTNTTYSSDWNKQTFAL